MKPGSLAVCSDGIGCMYLGELVRLRLPLSQLYLLILVDTSSKTTLTTRDMSGQDLVESLKSLGISENTARFALSVSRDRLDL